MRALSNIRIRYLILLSFSFIVVVVFALLLADYERAARLALVAEQLSQSARLISATQKNLVSDSDALLRQISADPDVSHRGRVADDCQKVLHKYLSGNPAFINAGITSAAGEVTCMALDGAGKEIDFSRFPFLSRALASDEMVISDVQTSPVTGRPSLYFARRSGRSQVIFVALDLHWLNAQLAQYATLRAGELSLIDGRGQQLAQFQAGQGAASAPLEVLQTDVDLFAKLLTTHEVGTAISKQPTGGDRLVGFANFARTTSGPAYLLISVDKAAVMAPAMRSFYYQMAVMVALLLIIWGVIFVGGGRLFISRINSIYHVTKRLAAGDLDARVGLVSHRDELDTLGHAFDDMASRLRAQQQELRSLNDSLARVNRSLKVLSSGNRALLECRSRGELLQRVCREIVRVGDYPVAAVARLGPENDLLLSVEACAPAAADGDAVAQLLHGLQTLPLGDVVASIRRQEPVQLTRAASAGASARGLFDAHGASALLFLPLLDNDAVHSLLVIGAGPEGGFEPEEMSYLGESAHDLGFGLRTLQTRLERDRFQSLSENFEQALRESLEDALAAISMALELRDPYTAGHQRRVAALSAAMASDLGLSDEEVHGIYLAGVVHDIGKMKIPAEILVKPAKLTETEYTLVKEHAPAGYDILREIEFPWPIAEMVRQHHERLDGSGYPRGLAGGAILFGARIIAVADVVESMASHRPYRPALGIDVALQEIRDGSGSRYDERVVEACVGLFERGDFTWPA